MRTKVPPHLGCTNPTCRAGGERIYTTHTFDQCTRPGGGASSAGSHPAQVPYPPRNSPATGRGAQGRGAQGRGRGAHGRGRGALAKAHTSTRCRICSGNHQYGQCPLLAERNQTKSRQQEQAALPTRHSFRKNYGNTLLLKKNLI